ncbi:MAG: CBS domain-containing protein, partial [Caldilineae bacterium]
MQIQGKAYRVCIYIGEGDRHRGRPLYMALVEFLRQEGASGATVSRGLAGFGAHSRIHTATVLALSTDLPVIVEWIDAVEQVERLLPQIRAMVDDGLITLEEVQVVQYGAGRRPDPLSQPVGDLMHSATTVAADASVEEVLNLLLERGYRCLPVADGEERLVGIITAGDLLERAGLRARLGLQEALSGEEMRAQLLALQRSGLRARDIMTHPAITVEAGDTLRTAVARMQEFGLKRLPVVDEEHRVVGLFSRIDVLRAVEYHRGGQEPEAFAPLQGASVAELMVPDAPVVSPGAKLAQVLEALEANRRRRVIVVDDRRRVLGIITDGD